MIGERVNVSFGNGVAKKLSDSSIYRHRKHLPAAVIESLQAKSLGAVLGKGVTLDELRAQESQNLLAHLIAYRAELDSDIGTARGNGDLRTVASLVGRRNHLLEVLARLLGELGITTVTNNVALVASPDYLAMRSALMKALMPFPDARRAVAAALTGLEAAPKLDALEAPRQIEATLDVIDVIEIASDVEAAGPVAPASETQASSAPEDIEGVGLAGEVGSPHPDQPACPAPEAVVRLEQYINGATHRARF
ncbi:MAG: hypothetical protein WCD12_20670 [Candidatus Binatus sp.]|uniref:hypothetical protein n=1 Tax=Candidatus Binatus sp. TaxID=2811406 RepID=UPI003C77DC9F